MRELFSEGLAKKTCVGLAAVFLMVVTAFGPASGQAESGAAAESIGFVPSPYTFFDTVGDGIGHGDITAVRVRNASDRVVLRFWARHWDPNEYLNYVIDPRGPGVAYWVIVNVAGSVQIAPAVPFADYTCSSHNVSDLGSDALGHSVSARFRPRCIGGSRAFRTLLSGGGDWAPNPAYGQFRYTPWIRPSS